VRQEPALFKLRIGNLSRLKVEDARLCRQNLEFRALLRQSFFRKI